MGIIVRNITINGKIIGKDFIPAVTDNFKYNTLLLPGTGSNNTANNTFIDSSSNNFTITASGNPTQGSFSPFSTAAGYYSNYFDGVGDYLRITNNSAFAFGTNDFTIESLVYVNAFNTLETNIVGCWDDSISDYRWLFCFHGSNKLNFYTTGKFSTLVNFNFNTNRWYHVAVIRQSGIVKFFVDGVQAGSNITDTVNIDSTNLFIGGQGSTNNVFNGYISNVRIVKGTALYTTNFTPSTTPLTAVANTSLLTCNNNRFMDSSSNNFSITAFGNTSVSAYGPFDPTSTYNAATMGGSMYFDGVDDNLYLPGNANLEMGSENFTIEFWLFANSVAGSSHLLAQQIADFTIQFDNTISDQLMVWDGSRRTVGAVSTNTWTHFALVRSGTTLQAYLNGVAAGSSWTNSSATRFTLSSGFIASRWGSVNCFNGYISNLRAVKGTAVYTSNFTPPTAPVTAIANTQLLLNGTNAAIVDTSAKNVVETVGNAKISTTISANGSMYFDGLNDYLKIPSSNLFAFGTSNFTIEFWVYSGANANNTRLIGNGNQDSWGANKWIAFTSATQNNNKFEFSLFNYPQPMLLSTTSFNDSTWKHVAVTRSENTWRLFVNGLLEDTITSSISLDNNVISPINLGRSGLIGDADWSGYINDLRVTKGLARYTANFTPPTRS